MVLTVDSKIYIYCGILVTKIVQVTNRGNAMARRGSLPGGALVFRNSNLCVSLFDIELCIVWSYTMDDV